jgi:hypothetical protein
MDEMKSEVIKAMKAGCFGITFHRITAPGGYAEIEEIIEIADIQVDAETNVNLTDNQKTLASIYLASSKALLRTSYTASTTAQRYQLGRLSVANETGNASTSTLRQAMADKYLNLYHRIINQAGDGTAVRRINIS